MEKPMKLKDGFILRKIPGMNLIIPAGENIKTFKGALMLNDTAAFVYERLQSGVSREEIAEQMTQEYDVTLEKAQEGVEKAILQLVEGGVAQ